LNPAIPEGQRTKRIIQFIEADGIEAVISLNQFSFNGIFFDLNIKKFQFGVNARIIFKNISSKTTTE